MLTARAYTLRQKSRLAISLSWIAGYTNVVTLIYCGIMTSHVTGNVTHFGQHISQLWGNLHESVINIGFCFFLIFSFWIGAVLSGIMMQAAQRHMVRSQYILPMAFEALLLTVISILISLYRTLHPDSDMPIGWVYAMTGCACCAMGLQNATVTQVSGSIVRTTHLTGVVTDLGTDLVQFILWFKDKVRFRGIQRWKRAIRASRRNTTLHRLVLLYSIGGSFLFGVLVGTLVVRHFPVVAMIPPVLFLVGIIYIDWYQPIADLKELDYVHDPELKAHGIDKSMLPREVLLFRVSPRMSGTQHHAPSFLIWAEDVPHNCRVAVLSLYHHMHFDGDAALDMQAAFNKLRSNNCHLVLAGVRPEHYDTLNHYGVMDSFDVQDLCSDLEFAVARAIDLIKSAEQSSR